MSGGNEAGYLVEELADAKLPPKAEVLAILESLTLSFLESLARGEDPSLHLASRSGKNVVRDDLGRVHLGKTKTVKKLFSRAGTERFVKIWQVLELVQRLLQEDKMATQREAYYCLVNHFKDQAEFNSTLQDVVALTGCARAALGICASSSGAVAGLLTWQDEGGEPIDCSTGTSGKRIPGVIEGVRFECLGARYILVVEKDAVFTYLCGQRIWDTLPCVVVTGCGYPPLSVRATVKKLSHQFSLPVLGLFDYNPHGLRILLTYKFGSRTMGLESHAFAVEEMRWLGVHHGDIFDSDGKCLIDESALQPWGVSDHRVFRGIRSQVEAMPMGNQHYSREVQLMEKTGVKAEIEALNTRCFDSLSSRGSSRRYYENSSSNTMFDLNQTQQYISRINHKYGDALR